MAFKIALTAGHYKGNVNAIPTYIDPKGTTEWWLNSRIADKIEKLLKNYTGYELIRTDDPTGVKCIELEERTDKANNWDADFYLSIHHNGGINGGYGGGIVSIAYPGVGQETKDWQKDLYDALIAATGLKGDRSNGLAMMDLHEVRETNMPAVLLELGFMDSRTDAPIILTEKFADQCADAIVKVLVKKGGLKKKVVATPKPTTTTTNKKTIHRVQIGAFSDIKNAENQLAKAKAAGFKDAFIVTVNQ